MPSGGGESGLVISLIQFQFPGIGLSFENSSCVRHMHEGLRSFRSRIDGCLLFVFSPTALKMKHFFSGSLRYARTLYEVEGRIEGHQIKKFLDLQPSPDSCYCCGCRLLTVLLITDSGKLITV